MTVVAGALACAPPWSAEAQAKVLADAACRYPHLHRTALVVQGAAAVYALGPDPAPAVAAEDGAAGQRRIVLGEPASARAQLQASIGAALQRPTAQALARLPHGRWLGLDWDPARGTLRIATDPLGTCWVYVARAGDCLVFSGDFAAVARACGPLTLDEEAVLAQLALGYMPDDSTCFREVSLLPPGAVVELSADGSRVLSRARPAYGDALAGASPREKADRLDAVLAQGLADWCDGDLDGVGVSLSGGYDSRYGLALLHARGLRPPCLTWGHPRSHDARVAAALTRRLGLPWALYERPRVSWEAWQRCLEQVGASGFQWGGWAEDWLGQLAGLGSRILLGYLGDALSGRHLVRRPEQGGDWLRDWEAWSCEGGWAGSPLLRPHARARLSEVVRQRLEALAASADVAFPHQRALHLDLHARQRRFVAAQPNLAARFLHPLPFFYTRESLDFWGNLPWEDLRDQSLYRAFATARFPEVFPHARPRSRPGLPARLAGSARNVLVAWFPALRQVLRPTEVDLVSILRCHRSQIGSLLGRVRPLLDPLVDMAAVEQEVRRFPHSRLNVYQFQRLMNLAVFLAPAVERSREVAAP